MTGSVDDFSKGIPEALRTLVVVPSMLYALEIFVGIIQAYVFAMLALVFMSQATVGHGGEDHGDEHHEAAAPAH